MSGSGAAVLDQSTHDHAAGCCIHCGSPIPEGYGSDQFCCNGCEAAYHIVSGLGLDRYYQRREIDQSVRALKPDDERAPIDFKRHVRNRDDGAGELNLMIDGIHCAACVWLIESVLAKQPGVVDARVNMTTRRLRVGIDLDQTGPDEVLSPVTRLGYRLVPYDPAILSKESDKEQKELYRCLAISAFAAANIMLLSVSVWAGHFQGMGPVMRDFLHWVSALIALPTVVYAGRPFYGSAWAALKGRRVNMDVPITLAIFMATGISLHEVMISGEHAYFDSAVTLLFFLLIGRVLDRRARGRARSSAEHLLALSATAVTVVDETGAKHMLPPEEVTVGMTVLVAAGERIGIDGEIITGRSDVDAQVISGESVPESLGEGDKVFAGAVNLTSPLTLKVTAAGEDTLLAEIVRLMEGAEKGRASYVALADRVAAGYAPTVFLLAGTAYLAWFFYLGATWQDSLLIAISVLIITCPCSLALAVPVVQVVATGRLMRQGILLKSATALERLAKITDVVFDKTGTLTEGHPDLVNADAIPDDAFELAAQMAATSKHPLARALVRARARVIPNPDVIEVPGRGLKLMTPEGEVLLGSRTFLGVPDDEVQVGAELWLARPGHAPLRFAFEDRLKSDAAEVISGLKEKALKLHMLSGDRQPTVTELAEKLGITDQRGAMSPADKTERLAALGAGGREVLMVGDGLNDAPALATASVSMSPSTAADVSQTAADIIFQGDRLRPVTETITVARKAETLVKQNIQLSYIYNVFTIPLAMAGYVTPLIAAIAMSTSSIVVIVNALRLGRK